MKKTMETNEGFLSALKRRAGDIKSGNWSWDEMIPDVEKTITDGVLPILKPIGDFTNAMGGSAARAALAEMQAGGGMDTITPAFLNNLGYADRAPTGKDIAQSAGYSDASVSDAIPSMYSETGDEWFKLQKGGLLDPSISGTVGMGIDVATDPTTWLGVGLANRAAGMADNVGLAADNALASEAQHGRFQSKNLPAVMEEAAPMAEPFKLPEGLPKDIDGLEAMVKQGAPEGQHFQSANPYNSASLGDALREENVTRLPTEKIKPNYIPKEAEVVDFEEALKRRAQKDSPLDVVDEAPAPKDEPRSLGFNDRLFDKWWDKATDQSKRNTAEAYLENFNDFDNPTPDEIAKRDVLADYLKDNPAEVIPEATVAPFPISRIRDASKDPFPPGVDKDEFQAYAESPFAEPDYSNKGFMSTRQKMAEDAQSEALAKRAEKLPTEDEMKADLFDQDKEYLDNDLVPADPVEEEKGWLIQRPQFFNQKLAKENEKALGSRKYANQYRTNTKPSLMSENDYKELAKPISKAERRQELKDAKMHWEDIDSTLEKEFPEETLDIANPDKMTLKDFEAHALKERKAGREPRAVTNDQYNKMLNNERGITTPELPDSPIQRHTPGKDGLSPVQHKVLARFGENNSHIEKIMKAKNGDAYFGNLDVGNSVYAKKPSNLPKGIIPMPVPSSTTVADLPKVMGRSVLGKDVPGNFNDPFVWMDRKYKKSLSLLEESKQSRTPLTINTRSDLIAAEEYVDALDPKLHQVNVYFGPLSEHHHQLVNPGHPSIKRLKLAVEKLVEKGMNPTVYLDTFPDVKDADFQKELKKDFLQFQKDLKGARIVENPIRMDEKMLQKFRRESGFGRQVRSLADESDN